MKYKVTNIKWDLDILEYDHPNTFKERTAKLPQTAIVDADTENDIFFVLSAKYDCVVQGFEII